MMNHDEERGYIRVETGRPVKRRALEAARSHQEEAPDRYSGELHGTIQVLTPVHVGTGDLALPGTLEPQPANPEDMPLVAPFFRVEDRLTIPGSSLKGAFRHLFELVTYSCFAQYNKRRGGYDVEYELQNCFYRADPRAGRLRFNNELCPACLVFGGQGYQGQIAFHAAPLIEPGAEIDFAPQRWTPKVRPEQASMRKVYTHIISGESLVEPVEVLPHGARLRLHAGFRNLSNVELGLLLIVLGQDADAPSYPKLGALKAHGFGAVEIEIASMTQVTGDGYLYYEDDETTVPETELRACIEAAKDADIFYAAGHDAVMQAIGYRPPEVSEWR